MFFFSIFSWSSFITPFFFFQIPHNTLDSFIKEVFETWHWVPFLLSQQLFKGKFYHCLGHDVKNITSKSDCLLANYKWVRHKYNFDNLGQVSLFSDWAYQITWQILSNSVCCFVYSKFIDVYVYIVCLCVHLYQNYLSSLLLFIFFALHMVVYLSSHLFCSTLIYLCFPSISRLLFVLILMCVCFYRLWCPCLCWQQRTAGSVSCIMVWMQWQWTSR